MKRITNGTDHRRYPKQYPEMPPTESRRALVGPSLCAIVSPVKEEAAHNVVPMIG
jgi:hypothetical protein